MRIAAVVSFFLILVLFSTTVFAQLQYYEVDIILDEMGWSSVELTLTFFQPESFLNFTILGRVEGLQARSVAGLVNCTIVVHGISYISCDLPLTKEQRTVEITFKTQDFIKPLGEKFLFSGDFGLNKKIDQFFLSIRLPEGMVISDESELPFIENLNKLSDGRHIIMVWELGSITNQPLIFQILYEPIVKQSPLIWYVISGAIAVSVATLIFVMKKIRKPQEVILSVLDDYERKVMEILTQAGGEINQRRVVQQTNLSKAKVSRVVKDLAERGLIEIRRIGRINKLKIARKKIWT